MSNSTISYFSFRKLMPIAGLLLLTGCPPLPVTLKTVTLQPTDLSYGDQYDHSWSNVCDVPQPLPTYGTGPPQTSSGETLAGWFDLWYPGAQPFPCNNAYQTIVRGHVRFDLRQFDAVADASLTFSVDQSESNSMGTSATAHPRATRRCWVCRRASRRATTAHTGGTTTTTSRCQFARATASCRALSTSACRRTSGRRSSTSTGASSSPAPSCRSMGAYRRTTTRR